EHGERGTNQGEASLPAGHGAAARPLAFRTKSSEEVVESAQLDRISCQRPPITCVLTLSIMRKSNKTSCKLLRGKCASVQRQAELFPHVHQCLGELVDQPIVVIGRGRDAQPLSAFGNGRIVDRLDVDPMPLEQEIARLLATLRIADE